MPPGSGRYYTFLYNLGILNMTSIVSRSKALKIWLQMGKPKHWDSLTAKERKITIARALQITPAHLEVLLVKDPESRKAIKHGAPERSRFPGGASMPGRRGRRPSAKPVLVRARKLDDKELELLLKGIQAELAKRKR